MRKIICAAGIMFLLTGCVAGEIMKGGVTSTYGGVKTVFTDIGKVLQGGDITISIKTNAAYNDRTKRVSILDGKTVEEAE